MFQLHELVEEHNRILNNEYIQYKTHQKEIKLTEKTKEDSTERRKQMRKVRIPD